MANQKRDETPMIPTPSIGEILQDEFMTPLNITAYRLAKDLHVSTSTVLDLIHGKRRLSTDMALRLSRLFGMSERFWVNLQAEIDVRNRKREIDHELKKIHPIQESA